MARIDGGATVSGLAVTNDQVWVANQGGTTIDRIDPKTNKIVGHINVPAAPFWFATQPSSVAATLSNEGVVVLIDPQSGKVGQPITVGALPRDPGFVGGRLWVASQGSEDVSVIDPSTSKVIGSFTLPGPLGIWVAQEALGDGWVLDYAGKTAYRVRPDAGTQ